MVRKPITLKRLVVVNKIKEAELFMEDTKNAMRNIAEQLAVGEQTIGGDCVFVGAEGPSSPNECR